MGSRLLHVITAALLLFLLGGCGVTKQYMIPHDESGSLIHESRSKLRMAGCVNCDMWKGDEQSPLGYSTIFSSEGRSLQISASYRCFGWFIVIPFPVWGSCSSAVNVPRRQVVHLKLINEGKKLWTIASPKVRAFKGERELDVTRSEPFPPDIHPGESIIRGFDLGEWTEFGWGYELELSDLPGGATKRIPFERFTTTTFGVYFR